MDHEVPYDDLDPGIRAIVRSLNEAGLVTTDSGDGVSKLAPGKPEPCCPVNPFPHVCLRLTLDELPTALERVQAVLDAHGLTWAAPPTMEDARADTFEGDLENVEWLSHWDPRHDADHVFVLLSGWSLSTLGRVA